jgi:phosphoribosylamine---glycine ligase
MNVLVLGSGGREHALAWKLSTSSRIRNVFVGPGNAGTGEVAVTLPAVNPMDVPSVVGACRDHAVDCVFVGPEAPLAAGIVDSLSAEGIAAIGPGRSAARLESSKAFSKAFLLRNALPTAGAKEFSEPGAFVSHLQGHEGKRLVIKKSGLAAGKGVLESSNIEEMIGFGSAILREDTLLVEEFLTGWEVSIFGVSDGRDHIVLPPCTDFKKALDGDRGPNTGGMGSICPVPWVDPALMKRILAEVVDPTYAALKRESLDYTGVLYFGLMITPEGPKVLEFNVRFGDPETQVLMPVLGFDFGALLAALVDGELAAFSSTLADASAPVRSALGVVIASRGYPERAEKGAVVQPFKLPAGGDSMIFHASTSTGPDGSTRTGGGRCFTAVGTGADLRAASGNAYKAAEMIHFDGGWYRGDIGQRFIGEKS